MSEYAATRARIRAEIGDVGRSTMSRNWLSEALHRRDRSHLVYLGHVTTRGHSGRGASLELNDARSVFSTERIGPATTGWHRTPPVSSWRAMRTTSTGIRAW